MTGNEQRSLAGYKSKVKEQGDFDNPNEGKTLLKDDEEYVFRLKAMPKVKPITDKKKGKDGVEHDVVSDKAICIFEDEDNHNEVVAIFKIDSLNFTDEEKFESGVIKFFKKIKAPLPYGKDVEDWSIHFVVGMRFRGRVVIKAKKDKEGNIITNYYLDVPTCRPVTLTDKHPDAVASTQENAAKTTTAKPDAALANALLLAKGAKDFNTAMDMLKAAGSSKEVAMALFNANLDGKVTFPV
jgi:hypothetical protein